ncbi:MAG TPA: DEAD/DEAH box helicase [Candidatus Eisenbacteria bacterium]|nr:DEAD/DEAH box helicase [Candidatus Eisenbacteria bacterium]
MTHETAHATFHGLGISSGVLGVVDGLKFKVPTPIQQAAIPPAIEGKDILGIAQTGTGKTLAFGIPMIQALRDAPGRALILVPTRELALQVDETLRKLGNPFDIRSVIVIGGMDMATQVKLLQKETIRVVIATPGRLLDHFEQKSLKPAELKMVVLDEADRMLDMGFAPQIERLAKFLPKERQTLLFSATMPEAVVRIAALYTRNPVRVEVAPSGAAPEKIRQELFVVKEEDKLKLLGKILAETDGSVLIFTRTKAATWKLTRSLDQMGHKVVELHSDRTQGQRRHALNGFKSGLYRVLVATDIAARGIDVKEIGLVVNFELPDESENYVHRIGRTGRAGREGRAITFATPGEGYRVREIEKLMNLPLKVSHRPDVPAAKFVDSAKSRRPRVYEDAARHATGRPQFRGQPPAPPKKRQS